MKTKILTIIIGVMFISCGDTGSWSSADQQEWKNLCNDLYADYEYCDCTLHYLMERYSSVSELEREPDGGFKAGYDAGMACMGDEYFGAGADDGSIDLEGYSNTVDDMIEMDPDFSYDAFMEGCMVDRSFRDFCDCAYNKIEIYGFDYYMNNMESIASSCSHHMPYSY